jgi:type I restriction enzyme S subunit
MNYTTLDESCQFYNGKAHEKNIDENGSYVVVNSKFISSDSAVKKYTTQQMFPLYEDDIVMVMSDVPNGQALAKCFIIDENEKYSLNQRICAIRTKDFNIKFLYYQLNRHPYLLDFNNGENQTNLRKGDILKCPLWKPDFEIQNKVVYILDKAFEAIDQARANIERNIENSNELFKSKKDFLFDALSKECKVLPIESVCEQIFAGGDAPKENFSKVRTKEFNVPIIANAVKDNGLYGYTNGARVIKPSITVAARGSGTGHTEYRNYPFVPIVRLIVLTPDTSMVNAEFLMHAIKNLIIERSGSAIPQLTVPMMKSYSIPIPDVDKQTDVNKSLNEIDLLLVDYKSKLEQKLNQLEELKKSILQKAFTGELTEKTINLEKLDIAAEPVSQYQTKN